MTGIGKLGITAEMCRENALHCANALRETDTPSEGADLAQVGIMWTHLGLLCVALGDPDCPQHPENPVGA